jgi:hypothetical protein
MHLIDVLALISPDELLDNLNQSPLFSTAFANSEEDSCASEIDVQTDKM